MTGHKVSIHDLGLGLDRISKKGEPDQYDILEESSLEDQRIKEEINNLKSDRKLREKYADKIIRFLEIYAIVVATLICLHGFGLGFFLPDDVLITLAGSTAVAAIGLVGFVAKGLFNNTK